MDEEQYAELKRLAWAFVEDTEDQHAENGWHLADSFLPLLHYLRFLDQREEEA